MARERSPLSYCPIGPMHLHTYNFEDDECIWCGPNHLAWKPGHWVAVEIDGQPASKWSATEPFEDGNPS
jgi:hypothetical protein